MQPMSLARLLVWLAVLGAAAATVDAVRAGAMNPPDRVIQVAGLDVAVWLPPDGPEPYPLVLFSHGVRGCKTQSSYLMRVLADSGMLVAAPDHGDEGVNCPDSLPRPDDLPPNLLSPEEWNPSFYDDRGDDLQRLRAELEADPAYSGLIDTTRVALAGHSLGGYTVLALAGAWPGWKMDGIAAVVTLAPFSQPFGRGAMPSNIDVPVLFQIGTEDQLTPEDAARRIFAATAAPACIVAYQGANHFAWTDIQSEFHSTTAAATVAFLNEVFARRPPTKAILASPQTEEPECK